MIIAIDGPSGAGKSTLGKMLAAEFDLLYLDTGAMYRAVGLAVANSGIELDDEQAIIEIAKKSEIVLRGNPQNLRVLLNDEDVSDEIRQAEIGNLASIVSAISMVRRNLVERQRILGESSESGAVLDGRDIGTVVFPKADVKFFLTASPEARAQRRFEEDSKRGRVTTYKKTYSEITARDLRDEMRVDSPLKIAEDATVIDTTFLSEAQAFEKMSRTIKKIRPNSCG